MTATKPKVFTCYRSGSTGNCVERLKTASLTPGIRATFEISNGGTDTWKTYINSVYYDTWSNIGITSAYALVGAERYVLSDYNKGSFEKVQYYKKNTSSYSWNYWPGAKMHIDNDPDYNFFPNNVNSSTHWVYMDHR